MSSNLIMRIAAGAAVLVVILIATFTGGTKKSEPTGEGLSAIDGAPAAPDNGLAFDPIAEAELRDEYGVDADSPEATMRTLTLTTQQVRDESRRLQKENEQLQGEINRLLEMEDSMGTRVDQGVESAKRVITKEKEALEHQRKRMDSLVARLEKRMAEFERTPLPSTSSSTSAPEKGSALRATSPSSSASGYDIGLAQIPGGLGFGQNDSPVSIGEDIVWTQPLDATVNEKTGEVSTPKFDFADLNPMNTLPLPRGATMSQKDKDLAAQKVPFYTIPANSTIMGSTAFTALMGRIPTGGEVEDPYPIRLLAGPEGLASNGIVLPPEVTGIVMSGFAVGDLALECVRADIRSMTFTFASGEIVTLPQQKNLEGQQQQDVKLGYVADKYGVPCIPGELVTNAAEVVSIKTVLGVAEGYANANAAGQFTTQSTVGGGMTSGLTGDPNTYARNSALAGGVSEISDWYNRRVEDSWDVVYVPPGTELSILIDRELALDLNPNGRKVNHYANANLARRSLD